MRIIHFAALVSISILANSAAYAQDKPLPDNEPFCAEDQAYTVDKSSTNVRIFGSCTEVTVSGSNNTVQIELTHSIRVTGDNNKIEWVRALGRVEVPAIKNSGKQNVITRAQNR